MDAQSKVKPVDGPSKPQKQMSRMSIKLIVPAVSVVPSVMLWILCIPTSPAAKLNGMKVPAVAVAGNPPNVIVPVLPDVEDEFVYDIVAVVLAAVVALLT